MALNSETLFSMALGLHTPWQFKDMTFSTNESSRGELNLRIDFESGSWFLDEKGNLCPIYDAFSDRLTTDRDLSNSIRM